MSWERVFYHPVFFMIAIIVVSLLVTVVLFKFLKSSAEIIKPGYRAGGAVAGFLLILLIVFSSTNKWLNRYLVVENVYDITGVVLLDSTNYNSGTTVKKYPPVIKDHTYPDGSYLLRGVRFKSARINTIELQFEREEGCFRSQTKSFDNTQFTIDKNNSTIHILDTVKLKRYSKASGYELKTSAQLNE